MANFACAKTYLLLMKHYWFSFLFDNILKRSITPLLSYVLFSRS